ncbi:MAG: 4'-phosphopantetheinyl transferase family protein [Acutalibacteraceae bacterium]
MRESNKSTAHYFAWLITAVAACQKLNIKIGDLCFEKGDGGKPFLKNHPKFYFSISHSKNFAAVAFSDTAVGLDIEVLRPVNLKLANRFFSPEESAFAGDELKFLQIWTRKEAYLKQSGIGLSTNLSAFNTLDNAGIKTFKTKDLVYSVASSKSEFFDTIFINHDELINMVPKYL